MLDTNRPEGWVQTGQSGNETSEPGYESSGYERSMSTKRLVTCLPDVKLILVEQCCDNKYQYLLGFLMILICALILNILGRKHFIC